MDSTDIAFALMELYDAVKYDAEPVELLERVCLNYTSDGEHTTELSELAFAYASLIRDSTKANITPEAMIPHRPTSIIKNELCAAGLKHRAEIEEQFYEAIPEDLADEVKNMLTGQKLVEEAAEIYVMHCADEHEDIVRFLKRYDMETQEVVKNKKGSFHNLALYIARKYKDRMLKRVGKDNRDRLIRERRWLDDFYQLLPDELEERVRAIADADKKTWLNRLKEEGGLNALKRFGIDENPIIDYMTELPEHEQQQFQKILSHLREHLGTCTRKKGNGKEYDKKPKNASSHTLDQNDIAKAILLEEMKTVYFEGFENGEDVIERIDANISDAEGCEQVLELLNGVKTHYKRMIKYRSLRGIRRKIPIVKVGQ